MKVFPKAALLAVLMILVVFILLVNNEEEEHLLRLAGVDRVSELPSWRLRDLHKVESLFSQNNESDSRCSKRDTTLDCSNLNFSNIPDFSQNSSNVTILNLSGNYITEIKGGAFQRLYALEELDLSINRLSGMHEKSFSNLTNLKVLNLTGNQLAQTHFNFSSNLFDPLRISLTMLLLHNNTRRCVKGIGYPDTALARLKNLKALFLDGLTNQTFGIGFSNLTNLVNLSLVGPPGGWCDLQSVSNDTFTHLGHISGLFIRKCYISQLDEKAFTHLKQLNTLDISNNPELNLTQLGNALGNIWNLTSLKRLFMREIVYAWLPGQCVTTAFAECLPRHLEFIDASSNSFQSAEAEVIHNLPPNLTHLILGNNRWVFGNYLKNLSQLTSLKHLELDGITEGLLLPLSFPPNDGVGECCQKPTDLTQRSRESISFPLPPNLIEISMKYAGLSNKLSNFHFNQTNNLQTLILDGNNLPELQGNITGLNQLTNLSLRGCGIVVISSNFFNNFPALRKLDLSNNRFGPTILDKGGSPLFSHLANLTHLNLSSVFMTNMSKDSLKGLDNLEVLSLSHNIMYNFTVDISNMTRLIFIDFTYLNLHSLDKYTRDTLTDLSSNNLTIDITSNPIHCMCDNLKFLAWAASSRVVPKNKSYRCLYEYRPENLTDSFTDTYNMLHRECVSNFIVLLVSIAVMCLMCVFIIGSFVYRFRWKLRYLYYSAYIYYKKQSLQKGTSNDYTHDVFISYSHQDRVFTEHKLLPVLEAHGLKVQIHGRDFSAGELITSNIVNAVQTSRHTLVVLTNDYLRSQWGTYEVEMANLESVHNGRQALVFLIMEDLNRNDIRPQLLVHIQTNTYMRYPETEEERTEINMEQFWNKLVTDLRS